MCSPLRNMSTWWMQLNVSCSSVHESSKIVAGSASKQTRLVDNLVLSIRAHHFLQRFMNSSAVTTLTFREHGRYHIMWAPSVATARLDLTWAAAFSACLHKEKLPGAFLVHQFETGTRHCGPEVAYLGENEQNLENIIGKMKTQRVRPSPLCAHVPLFSRQKLRRNIRVVTKMYWKTAEPTRNPATFHADVQWKWPRIPIFVCSTPLHCCAAESAHQWITAICYFLVSFPAQRTMHSEWDIVNESNHNTINQNDSTSLRSFPWAAYSTTNFPDTNCLCSKNRSRGN